VTLPTVSLLSKFFVIVNTSGGDYDLNIKAANGQPLASVTTTQRARVFTDGVTWSVSVESHVLSGTTDGFHAYAFAGDAGITTSVRLLYGGARSTDGPEHTTDIGYVNAPRVLESGTVDVVTQAVESAGNQTWGLYKNGSLSESIVCNTFYGTPLVARYNVNTAVTAGDYVSYAMTADTSTLGDQRVILWVRDPAVEGPSFRYGRFVSGSPWSQAEGYSFEASFTSGEVRTEFVIADACVDVAYAHASSAGASDTKTEIRKNGAIAETITWAGADGRQATAGTSYAALDNVANTLKSPGGGTSPGLTTTQISFANTGSERLLWTVFAGDASAANAYLVPFNPAGDGASVTTATQEHVLAMP